MQQLPYYPFMTRGGPVKRKLTYDVAVYTEDGHYFAEDNNGHIFCQDSPTACIQEAVNYVLSKPTGGRVYIRAGDYYLAPLTSGYSVVSAAIPYNAALIVEGDGDATRIHLPQNNSSVNSNTWLFGWTWNGAAPYTRKSKLRNIAFINDVNTNSYSMNVLMTSASTNDSSGFEVDSVSVYDIQGTALWTTFWINSLYDVTFTRYRFFSINSNTPNTAVLFDSVTLGKIVDSFIFTVHGGSYAIDNGTGSIQVDSTEIYGGWGYAFDFGNTDGESNIDVTNSIIGTTRGYVEGIQGYSIYAGPSNLINNGGNGIVRFTITSSKLLTPISYNSNNASYPAYIVVKGNLVNTGCIGYVVGVNPGTGQIYMDVSGNVLGMMYGMGSCGGNFITGIGGNTYLRIKNNLILDNGNQSMWFGGVEPSATIEVKGNEIYIFGTNNGYSARNQFILFGNSSSGGLLKFINNTVTWTATPSNSTTFYLTYNPNSSGTYYMPNIIMKGNTFNFPTSNAAFGGFVGSAGATTANPSALFVDLDNTFNLSGINLPYPSVTTPAVPSSGTAQSNTYPYPVEAYISGGSATAVQVTRGGLTYTVWSSSTATAIPPLLVRLEPGDSITLTYSTAPSWVWLPARFIP